MTTKMLISTALVILMITQARGQQGLECYKCSYFKIESKVPVIGTFLDAISSASDDHCKLEREEDKEEIGRVFCPAPDEDEENKCVVVKGEVKGKLNLLLLTFDFKYYTVDRACITVRKGEYPDGCQEDLPASGPVRNLIQGGRPAGTSDIKFKGEACYYSYLTTGAEATKASVVLMSLALFFVVGFWNVL